MQGSKYTDEFKSEVLTMLYLNNGNVKKTSESTNVPEQTLRDWLKERHGINDYVREVRDENLKEFRKDLLEALRIHVTELKSVEKAKAESALGNAKVSGIIIEKVQLIDDKPTSITESRRNSNELDVFIEKSKAAGITFDSREEAEKVFQDLRSENN